MEADASAEPQEAAARYVVFAVEDLRLAVDLDAVSRVTPAVEIQPLEGGPGSVAGVVVMRGERIPVVDLRSRLGLATRELELSDRFVLVDRDGWRWFLIADAVIGAVELPEAQMRERPRGPVNDCRHIDVELAEGVVSLIDLNRLVPSEDAQRARALLGEGTAS